MRLPPPAGVAGLLIGLASTAAAQMPATPVLQNAWTNAGITVAADFGRRSDASAYALALAWAPKGSRFQISVGGGVLDDTVDTRAAYGARLSIPLFSFASGRFGTAAFGGVGFAPGANGVRESAFPMGVALGFRHALGPTRGISLYAAPFALLVRSKSDSSAADPKGLDEKTTLFRASVGVDVTLASQFGITVGYEDGARAAEREFGPRSGVFGVALSYALRRQQ
ncbi:MAG TPA: hypothetical protein VHM67_02285 [Gemmatimonadaceae bacterium]|nr:hypothetical protein [Gemmatimonadaceae bacterium]